jgi:acetyl esterase/lipase
VTGPRRLAYGPGPDQHGRLWIPDAEDQHPVVVLVHGGFWREKYRFGLMTPLAEELVVDGFAVWNIEYRRVGPSGGGWPATLQDVAAAVDHLGDVAAAEALDLTRVAVVGHSAGGQLALWIGQRGRIEPTDVGGSPRVIPRLVIGQAPVADLIDGARIGVGDGAVIDLIGGSVRDRADAYAHASPAELLPIAVDQFIVHGLDDDVVPSEMSERYRQRVGDTDRLTVRFFEGTDHMDVIDPTHESWQAVVAELADRIAC